MQIRDKYFNNEIIALQHDRDYFVQKADATGDPGDRFVDIFLAKRARSRYCHAQAVRHNQNPRKYWYELGQIAPDCKPVINNLSNESTGERIPENQLAEQINNNFVDIGIDLAKKLQHTDHNHETLKPYQNSSRCDLTEASKEEILRKVKSLSSYKSSGMKDISTTFIKNAITALITELCQF